MSNVASSTSDASPVACAQSCTATGGCKGFVFTISGISSGLCWLKSYSSLSGGISGSTGAVLFAQMPASLPAVLCPSFFYLPGYDFYPNNNFFALYNAGVSYTLSACASLCVWPCVTFTYSASNGGSCWGKIALTSANPTAGPATSQQGAYSQARLASAERDAVLCARRAYTYLNSSAALSAHRSRLVSSLQDSTTRSAEHPLGPATLHRSRARSHASPLGLPLALALST